MIRALALLVVLVPRTSHADGSVLMVNSRELDRNRIAGHSRIDPSAETRKKIAADPKHPRRMIVTHKFCIDTAGNVSSVELVHSGGSPEYAREIETTMLHEWRFRPFEHDGKVVAVCSAHTQIYDP